MTLGQRIRHDRRSRNADGVGAGDANRDAARYWCAVPPGPYRPGEGTGLALIIPVIDRLTKVSLRIITIPIQSEAIITRDYVSVDISAVAYFPVVDAVKSVVAIENASAAIDQIAQTALRKVVGSTPSTRRCPKPTSSSAKFSASPP
jgi:regulator of protease activity HflC (stomatin/prohibitin superfamily)